MVVKAVSFAAKIKPCKGFIPAISATRPLSSLFLPPASQRILDGFYFSPPTWSFLNFFLLRTRRYVGPPAPSALRTNSLPPPRLWRVLAHTSTAQDWTLERALQELDKTFRIWSCVSAWTGNPGSRTGKTWKRYRKERSPFLETHLHPVEVRVTVGSKQSEQSISTACPGHGWRALPSLPAHKRAMSGLTSETECWLRMWPSSAVIKWCAKNGEMSLKTFQGSDSIARTSYCCQMFPEWKLIPCSTGKHESPYIHQKEEREVPWSQSFPHWASARGTDIGNGFLKNYFSLPFPLCLLKTGRSPVLGHDSGSESSLDNNHSCPQQEINGISQSGAEVSAGEWWCEIRAFVCNSCMPKSAKEITGNNNEINNWHIKEYIFLCR